VEVARPAPSANAATDAPTSDDGGDTATPVYGCGKCRWSAGGCTRCRAAGFVPGPREGRAGGIPAPGTEMELAVVGALGDDGGLRVSVAVTDDTPICNALRGAGLPPGVGLVAHEHIAAGAPVIEYVGEVLTREQAELREAWYRQRGLHCSYPLFTEMHGFVIDATLYGNAARFMNASCEPNLKPARMPHTHSLHLPRVLFRAVRDIAPGEELTWRYFASQHGRGEASIANARQQTAGAPRATSHLFGAAPRCFCGSRKCGGSL
jgi:hypothetical protein